MQKLERRVLPQQIYAINSLVYPAVKEGLAVLPVISSGVECQLNVSELGEEQVLAGAVELVPSQGVLAQQLGEVLLVGLVEVASGTFIGRTGISVSVGCLEPRTVVVIESCEIVLSLGDLVNGELVRAGGSAWVKPGVGRGALGIQAGELADGAHVGSVGIGSLDVDFIAIVFRGEELLLFDELLP